MKSELYKLCIIRFYILSGITLSVVDLVLFWRFLMSVLPLSPYRSTKCFQFPTCSMRMEIKINSSRWWFTEGHEHATDYIDLLFGSMYIVSWGFINDFQVGVLLHNNMNYTINKKLFKLFTNKKFKIQFSRNDYVTTMN